MKQNVSHIFRINLMLRNILFAILFILVFADLNAQDASAAWDIQSTTGGLLVPRMTEAERDLILTPALSLIIFNTTSGRLEINQTSGTPDWQEIPIASSLSGWSLTGNSSLTEYDGAVGNFLGTTDVSPLTIATTDNTTPQPIRFYTGNVERMVLTGDGLLGIGSIAPTNNVEIIHQAVLMTGNTLYISRNYNNTSTDAPVVRIVQDNDADAFSALSILQDGDAHGVEVDISKDVDEMAGIYSNASNFSASNQMIGLWGDASNPNAVNTATIGILATGNSNANASEVNSAIQINDGGFAMGRTSEAPGLGLAVEAAIDGTDYTQEGPSGVVELSIVGVPPTISQIQDLGTIVINNRYATTESIILVNVLDKTDNAAPPSVALSFFITDVVSRADGSFSIHLGMIPNETEVSDYTGDTIRVGYMIVNPGK